MANARNRGVNARKISINIWLSEAEKAALKERAGTPHVSTWLRDLGLGQRAKVRKSAARNRVVAIDAVMAPLLLAIAKVGNNLNQIARQANSDSVAGRSIEIVEIRFALASIRSGLRSIEEEVRRACEGLSTRGR